MDQKTTCKLTEMRGTVVEASADTVTQGLGMTSLPVTTSPMIIYISKVPDFLVF